VRRLAIVFSVLASAACDRGCSCDARERERARSDEAGVMLGNAADVNVQLGQDSARLRHAVVFVGDDEGLEVLLTTTPVACDGVSAPPEPYLSFPIPRGASGRPPTGRAVGTEMFIHFGERREMLFEKNVGTITLAELAPRGGARRIRGSLALDVADGGARSGGKGAKASGTFEATICEPARDATDASGD
jgi:hypothetical protein